MEDVLETYQRDFAEEELLICLDETSKICCVQHMGSYVVHDI